MKNECWIISGNNWALLHTRVVHEIYLKTSSTLVFGINYFHETQTIRFKLCIIPIYHILYVFAIARHIKHNVMTNYHKITVQPIRFFLYHFYISTCSQLRRRHSFTVASVSWSLPINKLLQRLTIDIRNTNYIFVRIKFYPPSYIFILENRY